MPAFGKVIFNIDPALVDTASCKLIGETPARLTGKRIANNAQTGRGDRP